MLSAQDDSNSRTKPSGTLDSQPRTYRLALGLFRSLRPLAEALMELGNHGHSTRSMCLIGSRDCMDRAHRDDLGLEGLGTRLLRDLLELSVDTEVNSPMAYTASRGALHDELLHTAHGGWPSALGHARIRRHLEEADGLVLIVSSSTPAVHDASCRSLLRHVQNGLLTDDFTIRTR